MRGPTGQLLIGGIFVFVLFHCNQVLCKRNRSSPNRKWIPTYAGPYRVFGRRVWNESDEFRSTGEYFMVRTRFTPPRNGREQYIWGTIFMGHPLTDDLKMEVRLSVWANNQWKRNAFIFKFDHGACTALFLHARCLPAMVLEPHEMKCPVMPFGHREFKNQTFAAVFPHFPVMPYGRYLFDLAFSTTDGKTTLGVIVGDVEAVPKIEIEK